MSDESQKPETEKATGGPPAEKKVESTPMTSPVSGAASAGPPKTESASAPPVVAAPKAEAAPKPVTTTAPGAPKPVVAAAKPSAKKSEEEKPSRRDLLSTSVAIGAGWICFGGATAIAVGPALGRFLMPNVTEEPDPKVRCGPMSKYREMKPAEVNEDFKPEKIWMIREEDKIAALSTTCTHLGCIPNWLPNDRKFKCPCHGSGFYPTGINFEGPAPRPLERFKIYVDNGIVVVDRSRKFQQEMGQWELPDSFLKV